MAVNVIGDYVAKKKSGDPNNPVSTLLSSQIIFNYFHNFQKFSQNFVNKVPIFNLSLFFACFAMMLCFVKETQAIIDKYIPGFSFDTSKQGFNPREHPLTLGAINNR